MVRYEDYGVNPLGMPLTRAFSDEGFYIEREGVEYAEAIDPTDLHRQYTETDHIIDDNDATVEDYEAALERMGVEI